MSKSSIKGKRKNKVRMRKCIVCDDKNLYEICNKCSAKVKDSGHSIKRRGRGK